MSRVLVLGGGICGLGTALLLARDGHDVTVVERDDSVIPDDPVEAWDGWRRKGVGQFRQPHNFMPGLRLILEEDLPDVQEMLRRAGALRVDMIPSLPPSLEDRSPRPIDEQLWTYTARRPAGEWAFAKVAASEPRLTLRRGVRAVGLVTGTPIEAGVPHVTGVRLESGEELHADLVVDAMGRASRSIQWLEETGGRPPHEEAEDCGFAYYSRYFRGTQPESRGPVLSLLGTIAVLTLRGDNGTWSVTIFTISEDRALATLKDPDVWTRVIERCPLHAHWLDGEPITDILVQSGVVDRYRRFVLDGKPVVTGFAPVADAWACTNPSAGRGLTVGFKHAVVLRDTLRDLGDDAAAFARELHDRTEREIAPWYHAQVATDRTRYAAIRALIAGKTPPPPADGLAREITDLFATMGADADLFRAALEYVGTITPVQRVLERPEIAERIAEVKERQRGRHPEPLPGPSREELLALVSG